MNDSNFEKSLRALAPARPSESVEERIALALGAEEPKAMQNGQRAADRKPERKPVSIRFEQAVEPLIVRCFHSLGWAVAGAASALAVIAVCQMQSGRTKSEAAASRQPVPTAAVNSAGGAGTVQAGYSESQAGTASAHAPNAPAASATTQNPVAALDAGLQPAGFQPEESSRELISTEEGDQILYGDDKKPVRQLKLNYKERRAWTNPQTGARMEIEVPRQDVFLVPVSMQ